MPLVIPLPSSGLLRELRAYRTTPVRVVLDGFDRHAAVSRTNRFANYPVASLRRSEIPVRISFVFSGCADLVALSVSFLHLLLLHKALYEVLRQVCQIVPRVPWRPDAVSNCPAGLLPPKLRGE